jgi:hypothetical protein
MVSLAERQADYELVRKTMEAAAKDGDPKTRREARAILARLRPPRDGAGGPPNFPSFPTR